jgi:large subunit ribosomal protein L29
MASKRHTELQSKSVESIRTEISTAKDDLARMKFDHASKGIENPLLIGETKKDVARMLTELRAREITAMTPEQLAKRSKIRLRRK